MTRTIALLVAFTIGAGSLSPLAAHERVPESSAGDTCPMMAHRPATTPCIGEPCPCHHGSDGLFLPDGVRLGAPAQTTTIAAPVTPSVSLTVSDSPCAIGLSDPLDHPPKPFL